MKTKLSVLMKTLKVAALAGVATVAWTQTAAASISIGFSPAPPGTVTSGDLFTVDIIVSGLQSDGLDEIVSAFDLDVTFDPAVLDTTSWSFDSTPFGGAANVLFGDLTFPGVKDIWAVSLVPDADLAALQGDSVVLGTLGFTAIADGPVALGLYWDEFNDVKGRNNQVIIPTVPEPATVLLFGLGLAGAALTRRRRD
jgi:hypothetical protein